MSKTINLARLAQTAARYGISADDLVTLLRCERTLHRWSEQECGNGNNYSSWAIERDEQTDKPYLVTYPHTGTSYRTAIADREAGAKKRIARILARYPELVALYQGDPRGCSLYVARAVDVHGMGACNATSRGFAVGV